MGPNGSKATPPDDFGLTVTELQERAQHNAMAAQQRQVLEAMLRCELPLVLINAIYRESLGPIGVKLVLGEAPQAPGMPMKPRFAVALPWPIIAGLVKELSVMMAEVGINQFASAEQSAVMPNPAA